jgi:hypothetical protein
MTFYPISKCLNIGFIFAVLKNMFLHLKAGF